MSVFADVRVPVTGYPVGEWLAGRDDVAANVERLVPLGETPHYVWITGPGRGDVVSELRTSDAARVVDVLDELPDRTLVRVEWEELDGSVVELLAELDATVLAMDGTAAGWSLQARFPDQEAVTRFYRGCLNRDLSVELRGIDAVDGASGGLGLTDTQRETLAAAFEDGYFDVPRRITLTELADQQGVSEQAVSERLRRGLEAVLTATITDDSDAFSDRDWFP